MLVLAQRLPPLPLCQSNPTDQRCSAASVARAPRSSRPRTSQNATPPHKGQQPGRAAGGRQKKNPSSEKQVRAFWALIFAPPTPPRRHQNERGTQRSSLHREGISPAPGPQLPQLHRRRAALSGGVWGAGPRCPGWGRFHRATGNSLARDGAARQN